MRPLAPYDARSKRARHSKDASPTTQAYFYRRGEFCGPGGDRTHSDSYLFTPLRKHRLSRKRLKPPLGEVENLQASSWYVERVPEILWAVLIAGAVAREKRLGACAVGIRESENSLSPFLRLID